MNSTSEQRLLSEAEAAQYLRRGKTSFRAQVMAGLLPPPCDSNGNRKLWDRRALDRYIDEKSGIANDANPWDEL